MKVRAITFDFWRTLFREAGSEERQQVRADAFCKATGAERGAVLESLDLAGKHFLHHHIEHQRTLHPSDCVQFLCDRLELSLDPKMTENMAHIFGTAILQYPPVPIDGALEAVKAASARFPIGVISDAGLSPGSSLIQLLERNGFTPYFKTLTFSSDVGVAKPQRKMFETAVEALGIGLDELLHIGDLEFTDVAGAHAVGAKAALFAGDNSRYAPITKADYVFHSWQEFVQALPSIA